MKEFIHLWFKTLWITLVIIALVAVHIYGWVLIDTVKSLKYSIFLGITWSLLWVVTIITVISYLYKKDVTKK